MNHSDERYRMNERFNIGHRMGTGRSWRRPPRSGGCAPVAARGRLRQHAVLLLLLTCGWEAGV